MAVRKLEDGFYERDVVHKQRIKKEHLVTQRENLVTNHEAQLAILDKDIAAIEKLEG